MTREQMEKFCADMETLGNEILSERPDFCMGEWAGESAGEIVRSVTGCDENDFTQEEFEELIDAFFS